MSDHQFKTMQQIGGLLFRRLNDGLSEPDQAALEEWMDQQDPANRQFFEEVTDWEQIQDALQVIYQFDTESALADVQKKF
jgi:hypothetical protein